MSGLLQQATTTTTATLLLLVFIFLTPPTTTANIVVDHKGVPLVAGQYYYAIPPAFFYGGGLTMFNNHTLLCPSFFVGVITMSSDFGIPIKFDPQTRAPNKHIHTSESLNISFKYLSPEPMCRRRYTTLWAVATDVNTGKAMVVLHGEVGSDSSLFTLEDNGDFFSEGYTIWAKEKPLLIDEQGLLGLDSGTTPLLVVFVNGAELELSVS
ncbi:hypothetical protein RND81_09G181100 [Saponaria officinalis]|uniref:Uncharacterized protein n=1 Tax=Saponaria officinalis TaxID=3572 RepID=A0AAW1INU5_SAPOF